MFYCIFEDDERDDIQRLFRESYSIDCNNIIWSQGSSNIIHKIENLGYDNEYFVFMDLVPDNVETYKSYRKISGLKNLGYKIIIFPIPCAEYFMIKAFIDMGVLDKDNVPEELINKDIYYNSEFIHTDKDIRYINTFERFCKRVLASLNKECLRKSSEDDREQNNLKGSIYREDCPCIHNTCLDMTLKIKSFHLLKQYPCIPSGSIHKSVSRLTWNDCIKLHRKLIDDYNNQVQMYRDYKGKSKIDLSSKKYKLAKYMY